MADGHCIRCRSWAVNERMHGRELGVDLDLCDVCYWRARAEQMRTDGERLRNELERERMRLTACGVVAMSDTPESAAKARDMHPDYRSASCDEVARRVDECMSLRKDAERERCAEIADEMDCGPNGAIGRRIRGPGAAWTRPCGDICAGKIRDGLECSPGRCAVREAEQRASKG